MFAEILWRGCSDTPPLWCPQGVSMWNLLSFTYCWSIRCLAKIRTPFPLIAASLPSALKMRTPIFPFISTGPVQHAVRTQAKPSAAEAQSSYHEAGAYSYWNPESDNHFPIPGILSSQYCLSCPVPHICEFYPIQDYTPNLFPCI